MIVFLSSQLPFFRLVFEKIMFKVDEILLNFFFWLFEFLDFFFLGLERLLWPPMEIFLYYLTYFFPSSRPFIEKLRWDDRLRARVSLALGFFFALFLILLGKLFS